MEMHKLVDQADIGATFGRRKVAPRACVADSKPHIRNFLREALEEFGFITCECEQTENMSAIVADQRPDLFVMGLSAGGIAANGMLELLEQMKFEGKVLVFGPQISPMVTAILSIGEQLGLAMLPLLPTPFCDNDLRDRVLPLLPIEAPPNPPVDVAEAIHANWLELWYQPKIELRSLTLSGAEALIRLRHPTWGTLPPAYFIPDDADPHFGALSTFVTARAIKDWRYFVTEYGHVELAINLPVAFFDQPTAVENLASQMPDHPAFQGLIVELNGSDLIRHLPIAEKAARQLRMHNIGVSVDDLGTEWPLLMELNDFPFVEIKVDRNFVAGCADDRLKQSVCRRILELADGFGARTVAKGVETRADFLAVRELGFDLIQGFFFAKPMEPHKFARKILARPMTMPS
jgi:EAL domain-containing protein (putative c-di-GMP-specific phosphodiesterase class I)/CheY-like chemotaxis protein